MRQGDTVSFVVAVTDKVKAVRGIGGVIPLPLRTFEKGAVGLLLKPVSAVNSTRMKCSFSAYLTNPGSDKIML